jgi:organic radical activating enzyme
MDVASLTSTVVKVWKHNTGDNWEPLVVLTGGEPLRQPIASLAEALVTAGFLVQVETNGTLPPAEVGFSFRPFVEYVVSPKTGVVHPRMAEAALAYKYVIQHGEVDDATGLPSHALGHPAHPQLPRPPKHLPLSKVYVQPMDPDPDGENLAECVNSVLEHGYTLCLQTHKIAGVP